MPLIQSKSKRAFEKNIEAEMDSGKPKNQALAIAYDIKRKNKKKYAQGGVVSAKTESRPMPEQTTNDSAEVSRNAMKKALVDSGWTDKPTVAQAQSRPRQEPIKHPRIMPSSSFSVKLRDQEDHLQKTAIPGEYDQQPPERYNEEDASKMGSDPDMSKPHTTRKAYADGGMINNAVSMEEAEEDHVEHPDGLESSDSSIRPSEDEYMADHFAKGGKVVTKTKDKGYGSIIRVDNEDQPQPEAEDEQYDSIAAAIMAKKRKKMADGGMVDIDENAEEQPNMYYSRNQEALKENYDSNFDDVSQPMDSNEHDITLEDEDQHDRVSRIRSKMNVKRQFGK
jgi:hypothetical protein